MKNEMCLKICPPLPKKTHSIARNTLKKPRISVGKAKDFLRETNDFLKKKTRISGQHGCADGLKNFFWEAAKCDLS